MSWIMISISSDFNRMTWFVLVDGGGNGAGIKIGGNMSCRTRTRNLSTFVKIFKNQICARSISTMYFSKALVVLASHLALSCILSTSSVIFLYLPDTLADQVSLLTYTAATGCGTADACVGTDICTTVTFTSPTSTTVTTCVPTPTCLGVYGKP